MSSKRANPQDLREALESEDRDDDEIGCIIFKMQVNDLKSELKKHALNEDGVKAVLQKRLADFYKVKLPTKEDVLNAKKKKQDMVPIGSTRSSKFNPFHSLTMVSTMPV